MHTRQRFGAFGLRAGAAAPRRLQRREWRRCAADRHATDERDVAVRRANHALWRARDGLREADRRIKPPVKGFEHRGGDGGDHRATGRARVSVDEARVAVAAGSHGGTVVAPDGGACDRSLFRS